MAPGDEHAPAVNMARRYCGNIDWLSNL